MTIADLFYTGHKVAVRYLRTVDDVEQKQRLASAINLMQIAFDTQNAAYKKNKEMVRELCLATIGDPNKKKGGQQ